MTDAIPTTRTPQSSKNGTLKRRTLQSGLTTAAAIIGIGILLPAVFWQSNLPHSGLIVWGLLQVPISLCLIGSLHAQNVGSVATANHLNMISLISWSMCFTALPWLNPAAMGLSPDKAMLIGAMLAVTGTLAATAIQFPRHGQARNVMLSMLAISYAGACLLHREWALASVVAVWFVFIFTTTEVNVRGAMELRRLRTEGEYMANHDGLTELLNRHGFIDSLETQLRQPQRPALALIDLDGFKLINDTLGHQFGDHVLAITGKRLRSALPEGSTIARIGGDEFAALIPHQTTVELRDILDTAHAIISQPIVFLQRKRVVCASIGIAPYRNNISASDWMAEADIAMYRCKQNPQTALWFYDTATRQEAIHRVVLEERFRKALTDGDIHFWCQPIVRTSDQQPLAIELLARWPQADGSFISPAEFIPIAQQASLLVDLGKQALGCAATLLERWSTHPQYCSLTVNVNISPLHLSAGLIDDIRSVFPSMDSRLGIEFVETDLISTIGEAKDRLQELSLSDLRLIIDDFGVGYSSLSYLWSLPFDTLKIDRSFIEGIESDPVRQQLIASIVNMAQALDITCVAEGIETEAAINVLQQHRVHELQGYRIARPQPVEHIEDTLATLYRNARTTRPALEQTATA